MDDAPQPQGMGRASLPTAAHAEHSRRSNLNRARPCGWRLCRKKKNIRGLQKLLAAFAGTRSGLRADVAASCLLMRAL
eukprot:972869-Prymnesium_polylepis.2